MLKGHANGTFTDATSLLPNSGTNVGPEAGRLDAVMRHLLVGDVNGDGRPDFVGSLSYEDGRLIGPQSDNVAVQNVAYVSDGPGHWNVVELDNFTWGHGLEVDDFDGDGRDDIISGGFTITPGHQGGTVLSQFPAGGPQTNTPLPVGGATYQLADVDGDGHNELVDTYGTWDDEGRSATSGLQVFEIVDRSALGTAIQSSVSNPYRYERGIAWNGDEAWIDIYRDADGHEYIGGGVPDYLKSGDFDGDGKEEIVGLDNRREIGRNPDGLIDAAYLHDPTTEVVFWGWNGTAMAERTDMTVEGFAPARYGVYEYDFVDFNVDGHLDLFVPWPIPTGRSPTAGVPQRRGRHFKVVADRYYRPAARRNMAWDGEALDINNDGIMDILIRSDGQSERSLVRGGHGVRTAKRCTSVQRNSTPAQVQRSALKGAAGFNEQYYLNTYADAKAAVAGPKFATGLEHYLEVGKKKGYFGFAVDTHIFGSDKNDTIKAREGEERLDGGLGKDKLTGKAGADEFVFSTRLGPTNVDTITDFKPGQGDMIGLDSDIFRKIGAALTEKEFYAASGATKAHDRSDRIVYDTKSGKLFYDADGSKKGGHDAIHFATLSNKAAIDVGDFAIV